MRLPLTLAAIAASAIFFIPPSTAEAGGLMARDHSRMWCPMDWMRRDRAAAPVKVAAKPAKPKKAKPMK